MALEAFNNLKEKKKESLLNAISTCLRRTNYEDLSVNEIVEEADISRGSFYNYFTNKTDAILSLVEYKIRRHFDLYLVTIKEANYKLFDGTRKYYYDMASVLRDEINLTIMKNLKFFFELAFESMKINHYKQYIEDIVKWLVDNTYEGRNYIISPKNMLNVLDMILTLVMNTAFLKISNRSETVNENFEYKLSIMEKGIM